MLLCLAARIVNPRCVPHEVVASRLLLAAMPCDLFTFVWYP